MTNSGLSFLSADSLCRLAQQHGTPLWVYSLERVRQNAAWLREAFAPYPTTVAYAIKACALPEVLRTLANAGLSLEAASGHEYALAREAGASGERIVLNGPLKTAEALERAFSEGARVNIDSASELEDVIRVARGRRLPVGLRVHFPVIDGHAADRFGFAAGEECLAAARRLLGAGLRLAGLHVHVGSYTVSSAQERVPAHAVDLIWPKPADLLERVSGGLVQLALDIERKLNIGLQYLDVGGGLPPAEKARDYAESVYGPLAAADWRHDSPTLIIEPGRALVADAGVLLTSVVAVRGPQSAVVDAGINCLPTAIWKDAALMLLDDLPGERRPTTVYGPLCLQTDILSRWAELPPLQPGALLVARDAGAYNLAQSSDFIFPKPSVVTDERPS
jgi:diaminopimelate decarboxylase